MRARRRREPAIAGTQPSQVTFGPSLHKLHWDAGDHARRCIASGNPFANPANPPTKGDAATLYIASHPRTQPPLKLHWGPAITNRRPSCNHPLTILQPTADHQCDGHRKAVERTLKGHPRTQPSQVTFGPSHHKLHWDPAITSTRRRFCRAAPVPGAAPPRAPTLLFLVVVGAALCAAPPVLFSRALWGRGSLSWPPLRAARLASADAPSAASPQRRTTSPVFGRNKFHLDPAIISYLCPLGRH